MSVSIPSSIASTSSFITTISRARRNSSSLSAANSPESTRARVVLPLPLSPTMERNALPGTYRSMRSRTASPVRDPEASRSPKLIRFATIAGGSARFR